MRRLFTTLSFLAAVLALSRCGFREQEAPEPAGGRPFTLVASPGETKTVNDGLSTKWEQDDPVSVFHAPSGGAAYKADGIFTIDNPETGHATGTITELSQGLYDWYLFYPGDSSYGGKSPGGNAVIPAAQTQSEYGSKAHLAGPGFPLGGKAEKVAWDAVPSVTLQPLAAVVKVHVTNAQATPARVTAVSFTAPEAVAGNFSVSWDGVFSATGENSETVTAAVAGGLLAQGESADIYLGIKPFQAAAGTTLTLRVTLVSDTGAETTAERSVTLGAATPFRRGLIKTLNYSFDGTFPAPKQYRFQKVTSVRNGHHYLLVATHGGTSYAGKFFADGVSSARMEVRQVTPEEGIITLTDTDGAFSFKESENGWTISQTTDGRFLFNNNQDNINISATPNAAGMYWTVDFDAAGAAAVANRTRQFKFNTTSSVMKFQTRLKTASGVIPELYELLDDELIAEEFLRKDEYGFYSFEGVDYCYTEGEYQLSVRTGAQGIAFRLLHPADYSALQVTPIPSGVAVGDEVTVDVKRFVKLNATLSVHSSMKVLKVEGDKVWLLSEDGSGIIAKTR